MAIRGLLIAAMLGGAVLVGGVTSSSAGEPALKVLAFGTSLTARGGWTEALELALARRLERPVSVAVLARPGATSDWALTVVDGAVAAGPDIVLIEFHANDAALHRLVSPARSRANLERLLRRLRAGLPHARLIVMAMNPMHGRGALIRPFHSRYVEEHRDAARQQDAEFLDHGPAWLRIPPGERERGIPDGTHPRPELAIRVMVPSLVERIALGQSDRGREGGAGRPPTIE